MLGSATTRRGVFGKKTLEVCDEDYSKAMADSVIQAIAEICRCPRTMVVDEALLDRVCGRVRIAVADGAPPPRRNA